MSGEGAPAETAIDLSGATYEDIMRLRDSALTSADYFEALESLRAIQDEARRRDGYDDTDARYYRLALQCVEDIRQLIVSFG